MVDVRTYTRDGCRGGQEQFKWDSLKEQDFKDREQYLGASTKVGMMAKFGRYQVHDWYAKTRDTAASIEEERNTVQQYEEELMQEALGLKPKKLLLAKKQLSEEELKEFLKKDSEKSADKQGREMMGPQRGTAVTDNDGNEVEASILYADARIKGLGFAAHRDAKLEKYKASVLGTESKLEGIKSEPIKLEVKDEPMTDTDRMRLGGGASSSGSGLKKEEIKEEVSILKVEKVEKTEGEIKDEPADTAAPVSSKKRAREDETPEEKKQRKAEKKEKKGKKSKKAEKKLKKKVKKAAKKEKKAAKIAAKMTANARGDRSRRAPSQSSESSSSDSS